MRKEAKEPLAHQFPASEKQLYPWLLYHHGKRPKDSTFCRISSSGPISSDFKNIPQLCSRRVIYCSPDGRWLLLCDPQEGTEYCSIWNPTTSESIGLPCVRSDLLGPVSHGIWTSTTPADPDCLILLFVRDAPVILYCRVSDEKWSDYNYDQSIATQRGSQPLHRPPYCLIDPVRFDGKIYATGSFYADLVQIDIDESNNCTTSLVHRPVRRYAGAFTIKCSLVACGDQALYFIYLNSNPAYDLFGQRHADEPQHIDIYKFSFSMNSWEEITRFNCSALFLGDCYSLSCPRDDHSDKEGSYIYFTLPNDLTLYSYRVEDERITSYLPCPQLPKLCGASLHVSWIMPAKDISHDIQQLRNVQSCSRVKNKRRWGMADSSQNKRSNSVMVLENGSGKVGKDGLEDGSGKVGKDGQCLLCDLSQEVLGLIAGNLSFVDFINFRCVNKICASATIRMRMKPFPPSLIYVDRVNGVYNIIDSNLSQKISVKIPEVLKGYTICCSKDGWLLMEYLGYMAFFNPFTAEVVPVGRLPREQYAFLNYTFLLKPSCSDCYVIGMSWFRQTDGFCRGIYSCGKGKLRKTICDHVDFSQFIDGCNGPAFLDGSFYYLGNDGRLGHLQPEKGPRPKFVWQIRSLLRVPCNNYQQNFLTECGGDLISIFVISIFVGGRGKRSWIRLFKLKDEDWEEISTLGSYSLYLCRSSSISRIAESPEMSNRIYFPRFYKDGLVYYSLNTKKYHSLGSQDTLRDLCYTNMYWNCAWIEPSWS